MPRPSYLDIDPIDVDPDGIAEAQLTAGAANLVLNGALCDLGTSGIFDVHDAGYSSGIGGVRIAIDSEGDINTLTFTVTGKDQDGRSATEDITGVTTTAVESVTYWSEISQIAVDGEVDSNVFVGPVDEVCSRTFPLNWRASEQPTYITHGLAGTINFDIDECFDDVQDLLVQNFDNYWYGLDEGNTANTGPISGTLHARAVRAIVNSYSSGAEFQFDIIQGGEN